MEGRQERGMQIAQQGGLTETPKGWVVPAQGGTGAYLVQKRGGKYVCNCPDCQLRATTCKHQWAVIYTMQKKTTLKKTVDRNGNTTLTKETKVTYTQDWRAYNASQTSEIEAFDILLRELVGNVEEPDREPALRGRKPLSHREALFCAIQKVYSQLSQRRAHTLYRNARDREQINHAPHFNAVGKILNREEITPILHNLLALSALPLKAVEESFALDSSGFRTSQFEQYPIYKYGNERVHKWVKAHILVGAKTNVVASARVTDGEASDCPQFEPLVMDAHDYGFEIREITADKAYSSRDNHNVANEIGATAYIPFRSNATGKSRGSSTWYKAYHYFQFNRDEFLQHYHQRSNVETAFMMIKAKFGDKLKSKNKTAQVNELLCKLIAHNIVVLIHEMNELGIKPEFRN